MNIQDLVDSWSEASRNQRTEYHVTLGELIEALKDVKDGSKPVEYSNGAGLFSPHSYRGYYADLGIEAVDRTTTVDEVLGMLVRVKEREFTAYKGGTYTYGDDAPLWKAEWGNTGRPVLKMRETDDALVLELGESEF